MKLPIILFFFVLAGLLTDWGSWAEEPGGAIDIPITLSKPLVFPDPPRLPKEVEQQTPRVRDKEDGRAPLSSLAQEKIVAVNVTWADPWFQPQGQVQDFLKELLSSQNEGNFSGHIWSFDDGAPNLVATVEYASGKQGAWWIWCIGGPRWAFQDDSGQWWFGIWKDYGKGPKPKSMEAFKVSALDILKRNEEGSGPSPNMLMGFLGSQWEHDPAVIAFFRDALAVRGVAALHDLTLGFRNLWDDSFLDPILKVVETSAENEQSFTRKYPGKNQGVTFSVFIDVLLLLHTHPTVWNDPMVSQRMSKAVLTAYPFLADPATASDAKRTDPQVFSNAVNFLSGTRDRSMVAVLRPYLKINELDGGGMRQGNTPLRVCDHVRSAIYNLLGEPQNVESYPVSGGVPTQPVGYPDIWVEWDKKNADLERQLSEPHD